MKFHLNCIIPNLDRRTDRWELRLNDLTAKGFPRRRFRRFPSFDGRRYATLDDAKSAATEYFKGTLPPYLDLEKRYLADYCWHWTWYAIISRIARRRRNVLTLFVIDDWTVSATFSELEDWAARLQQELERLDILQLSIPGEGHESRRIGTPIHGIPTFQHGLGGRCDCAIILSPKGARRLRRYADTQGLRRGPSHLFEDLTSLDDQDGCASVNPDGDKGDKHGIGLYHTPGISSYSDRLEGQPK